MRTLLTVSGCLIALGCASTTPERAIVDDAVRALGGADRLAEVQTLTLEGEGTQYNLGQDVRPDASGQTFSLTGWTRTLDANGRRARQELTRTPAFPYFQGQAPQRQIQGVDGDVGYSIAANGTAARAGAAATRERQAEVYHHPVTILRLALAPDTTLTNARADEVTRRVDVTSADGRSFTLVVGESDRPVRVESRGAHPNLGDVTISTEFADYRAHDGLQLPARLLTRVDDFTTAEWRVTSHQVDAAADLSAPAAAASAPPAAPPPPAVTADPIAPGLWLLAGQSHHSALVEFSDHLVLIEAPQSEARTLAVIAKARELVPEKPLRAVVTTHHHFDHTAGIRAAMAEGLTVITHRGNQAFFEEMGRRPHTLEPDAQAKKTAPVSVEPVDDERIFADSAMTMTLYHVAGNPHSETMLMAYFPRERVLVEVDVFSPASAVHPYAANLLDNIRKRELRVERIVPLHGAVAPFAELTKVAGAGGASGVAADARPGAPRRR